MKYSNLTKVDKNLEIYNIWKSFLAGGAVSGVVWNGKRYVMEEGFLLVRVMDDQIISWEYIDYGWKSR
jgi:hypothetical protein